ncbi:glycosyltransferase family 2 protein [Pedobacter aquatilis]|uniref:glycosyltransferase family 2 protein n=1 Tax=Pedobacter aquatilis TaxID=351343 RepID=UPI002930CA25|nr:glycosyltransferase family 2 protein [Pedobacter aquatilis]
MDISIIIVNYNTKDLLKNCIDSIYTHTHGVEFEIIVVDNASSDGSQEYIKNNFSDIVLICSDNNLGFGRANNLGVKYAKGEFLFLLNSDTLLVENSIEKLLSFFIKHQHKLNIGVVGTILVDEHLKNNGFGSDFPTCAKEHKKNLLTVPFLKHFVKNSPERVYDFGNEYFEIDYVIGADMLLKKSLFEEMGGFSAEFFMYFEESDLQKRISKLGYHQYIFTKTKIIHLEEGSGKAINNYSNKKRIITNQSRIIYLKRNDAQNFYKCSLSFTIILFLNFFNHKYTFKENILYFKQVLKVLLK